MKLQEDLYQKITRFVANNHSLDLLQSILQEFNPFKVLKVDQFEIRHSNMLAWLLDPKENHHLGDTVLKKLTAEVLCEDLAEKNHNLQISDVILGSFHDAEVLREWGNIDIVVISKKNSFILFIENKIHAGLAGHQLTKYLQRIKEAYPEIKHVIPVFLTLHGDESPDPQYYSIGHTKIMLLLQSILELHRANMNTKIADFIQYYIRTLEVLTMQDDRLINLCREIYQSHREAIEAIMKYGVVSTSTLNQARELLAQELQCIGHDEDKEYFLSDAQYWFIPKALDAYQPRLVQNWRSPRPITYFFAAESNRLRLILEVGPIVGPLRLKLLNHIASNDTSKLFSIKANSLRKDGSFTRIRTKSIDIQDWSDLDHVTERMKRLLTHEFKYDDVNRALLELVQAFDFEDLNGKV